MKMEIIELIKSKMSNDLMPNQLLKLENVLKDVLFVSSDTSISHRESKNLIKKYINTKRIEGCSKRTEEYYSSTLLFFEKNINQNILSVKTEDIRDYLIKYQKINNCNNVTLDTIRRILSSFYRWLEEEDYIIKSPMKRIHRIKSPVIIKPALSDEQIEVIRKSSAENLRNLTIIDLFLSSGLRVSELVNLNRSAINLNTRTGVVFGKGSKQREIYFDVRTKIELENYLKSRKDKGRALFVSSRKNKNGTYNRLTINSVEKIIRELGEKTDIINVHPHRFRRTLATRAIDKGMPIEQVQVLLGYSKIDTTLRYANVQQINVKHSHQKFIC